MALHREITGEKLSRNAESYNGWTAAFSESKGSVEKSVGGREKRQTYLTTADLPAQTISRFHTFVNKTDSCWLWTARVDRDGYGQLVVPDQPPVKAHRLAWLIEHGGRLLSSQHVLHRCDVPRCVNPAHLFLGNQAANMKDAAAKGRLHVARPRKQRVPSFVVDAIRRAPLQEGGAALARKYGVSEAYVSLVRRGKRRQFDGAVS